MKIEHAGATHVGMKREHNEDNLLLLPEKNLFVVADGMGGHSSGEVASQLAVDTIRQFFEETEGDDEITWPYKPDRAMSYAENRFTASVKLANRNIFEAGVEDPKYKGMGTTLVGVLLHDEKAVIAHAGDSRLYRIRDGEIFLITEDHSLLNDYKKIQPMTPEEEEAFPHKNIIVRALGMKENLDVEINGDTPQAGDIMLICSDGLCGELTDQEILKHVTDMDGDLQQGVDGLIQDACDHGGKDNVTVILVKFL